MKLQIIYRFINSELRKPSFKEERPDWFSKLKCFKSFYDSFGDDEDIEIVCQQDGDDGELSDYISQFCPIQKINANSNEKSLLATFDLAAQTKWDAIYFVEDDYLHLGDSYHILTEGLQKFRLITLYDHLDRYTRDDDVTSGKDKLFITNSCHWRTAESTTCTWATTAEGWERVENPARQFKLRDRELFRNLIQDGIRLVTPIYGRSTHVNKYFSSPLVDWEKFNSKIGIQ